MSYESVLKRKKEKNAYLLGFTTLIFIKYELIQDIIRRNMNVWRTFVVEYMSTEKSLKSLIYSHQSAVV